MRESIAEALDQFDAETGKEKGKDEGPKGTAYERLDAALANDHVGQESLDKLFEAISEGIAQQNSLGRAQAKQGGGGEVRKQVDDGMKKTVGSDNLEALKSGFGRVYSDEEEEGDKVGAEGRVRDEL